MPKRDRNHEIETLSQRAFESAMPPNVVVRPVSDDYGIDREVEVFDGDRATGLTFKVQLKGTDKSGASRRIKRDHLEYWQTLDVPVLIVSYETQTRTLRGRWVHSIGADEPDTGSETLTVHMDPTIDIAETWAGRLASDLSLIRAVRAGDIPNPTPLRVEVSEDSAVSQSQLTAGLLNLSRRTRVSMRATRDADEAALTVTVQKGRLQAALPLRVASCSLSLKNLDVDLDDLGVAEVADLVFLMCAGAVSKVNAEVAREWATGVGPGSRWWHESSLAEVLLPAIAHRDSLGLLLDVHASMVEAENPSEDVYLTAVLGLVGDAEAGVFGAYSARIRAHLATSPDGGRLAFNLANLHRVRRDFATAVDLLYEAAAATPAYRRDRLHQEQLAAALWEVERYVESADSYQQALDLGADRRHFVPLLADSLMHAGQYTQARDALSGWEPVGATADKVGVIHHVVLDFIVDGLGVAEQPRQDYDTDAAGARYKQLVDADAVTRENMHALLRDYDVLHPLPWHQIVLLNGDDIELGPALLTAFVLNNAPHAWVLALLGVLQADPVDEVLLRAIVDEARFLCGEAFYDAVMAVADFQGQESGEFLRELISAAYTADPETFPHHIRMIDVTSPQFVLDELTVHPSPPPRPRGAWGPARE